MRCALMMSALGQKQTFAVHQPMSALPPLVDARWVAKWGKIGVNIFCGRFERRLRHAAAG
jgi:hypothetical protein